jgi:hypothetical protein
MLGFLAGIAVGSLVVLGPGVAFLGWEPGHHVPAPGTVAIRFGPSSGSFRDINGSSSGMSLTQGQFPGAAQVGSVFNCTVTLGNWMGAPVVRVYNIYVDQPFTIQSVSPSLPAVVALHGNATFAVSILAPPLAGSYELNFTSTVG